MGRILFFVLLGVGLYVVYRIWRSGQKRSADMRAPKPSAGGEAMVSCNHCGLNVPRSEAHADGDRWYCSDAHRRLANTGR